MCRRGDAAPVIASTSGRAIPGTEVRVVDAAAPGRRPGEVLVRGFNVMRGYFEDAESHGRGPHRGRLAAHGRRRRPGRRGQPPDHRPHQGHVHRRRLQRLPGRDRATARPAPGRGRRRGDRRPGRRGWARSARRTWCGGRGLSLTADDLIAWARREMANYKVPRAVEFVGELPAEREREGGRRGSCGRGEAFADLRGSRPRSTSAGAGSRGLARPSVPPDADRPRGSPSASRGRPRASPARVRLVRTVAQAGSSVAWMSAAWW